MAPALSSQELVNMYDDLGLTVDEIMEQVDYERAAVLSTLAQYSPKYRKETRSPELAAENEVPLISDDEDREIVEGMKMLARCGDSEEVRARLLIYLHNEKKGRHDAKVGLQGGTINVLTINSAIKEARLAMSGVRSVLQLPGAAGDGLGANSGQDAGASAGKTINKPWGYRPSSPKPSIVTQITQAPAVVDIGEEEIR